MNVYRAPSSLVTFQITINQEECQTLLDVLGWAGVGAPPDRDGDTIQPLYDFLSGLEFKDE